MREIKKWWALGLILILVTFGVWYARKTFREQFLTYRMVNAYFTDSWQNGKTGRINLAKFIRIKEKGNIWTVKFGSKAFDIDINKADLIFNNDGICVNRLAYK